MKLLHIVASPRTDSSRTRSVADAFLTTFRERYPEASVEEVDVFRADLPDLTVRKQGDEFQMLGPDRASGDPEAEWAPVEREIERVKQADLLLISTPMWNFQIPYRLKHYIDLIVQPGYTFQYTADGPEGLLDASAVVVTSRGGDYSDGSGAEHLDFQAPYLETILGFVWREISLNVTGFTGKLQVRRSAHRCGGSRTVNVLRYYSGEQNHGTRQSAVR